jgi:hypothetical protein
MYKEENISTELKIIKGLYRNYEEEYTTSSMKSSVIGAQWWTRTRRTKNQHEND